MNEFVSYLKNYVRQVRVITAAQVTPDDDRALPPQWRPLLGQSAPQRCATALGFWMPFQQEFQQVIAYLQQHLLAVDVIHTERGYSLLYSVKAGSGSTMYYEGLAPVTADTASPVGNLLSKTPIELQHFYQQLHNGWYYFASRSMGPSPIEDMFVMDQQEWGILEEIGPSPIQLDQTLAVYTNGMGGYLCLELWSPTLRAHLWYSNRAPKLDIDFWGFMDTWTLLGFEG